MSNDQSTSLVNISFILTQFDHVNTWSCAVCQLKIYLIIDIMERIPGGGGGGNEYFWKPESLAIFAGNTQKLLQKYSIFSTMTLLQPQIVQL